MSRRVRVLVVDDSALVRRTVARLLEEDPRLRVVGDAGDGLEALAAVARLSPDVVTLDIAMPVMDGLACLAELVRRHRQRVVILSTLAGDHTFTTYKALALGAVDFVTKPGLGAYLQTLEELGRELREKVWTAAGVASDRIGGRVADRGGPLPGDGATRAESVRTPPRAAAVDALLPPRKLIGIGGSTGGAAALELILRSLPPDLPAALVIVQHLPPGFSASFARYLNNISALPVSEGREGEPLHARRAYVAPGGAHLRVQRTSAGPILRLDADSPPQYGYRPSITTLLVSIATAEAERAVGLLLSGMGDDGVAGLAAIRRLGGRALVQDAGSCTVFGMGERAVREGTAHRSVPLADLAQELRDTVAA